MPSMLRRRLLAVLSLLSLILCVGTVGLWVRSYSVAYDFKTFTAQTTSKKDGFRGTGWGVSIGKGGIAFVVEWSGFRCPSEPTTDSRTDREFNKVTPYWPGTDNPPSPWRRIGFCYNRIAWTQANDYQDWRYITIPLWFVAVVTAMAPCLWLLLRVRNTARADGLCPSCGYDLRATPGRCPECNWRVAEGAAK